MESRLDRFVVAAAALHAAAMVALVLTVRPRPLPRLAPREGGETLVDLVREAPPVIPTESPAPAAAAEEPRGASLERRAESAIRQAARGEAVVGSDQAGETPSARAPIVAAPNEGTWTFSAVAAPSPGREAAASTTGATLPDVPRAASGTGGDALTSVKSALAAHDHRVGLTAGGALVEVTREVVRASLVPLTSRATIELRTDAAGVVTSARVLDASGAREAWDEAARRLVDAARAHPARVPAGARGLAVTLRIDSRMRLPSGHDADGETSVSVLRVPVKKAPPGREGRHVDVGLASGIDVDPTDALLDATSRATRVVSTTIVREDPL